MIKKLVSIALCIVVALSMVITTAAEQSEEFSKTAMEYVKGITAGWNLGNTLDSCSEIASVYSNATVENVESAAGNPKTRQSMITEVYRTGFNAIRIPVSWYTFAGSASTGYKIADDWMARVKQVVGYAQKHDMYIIVNMHHDDKNWLNIAASDSSWETIKTKYQKIWEQIADTFKDYNEKLILESGNEIINGNDWYSHNDNDFVRINELFDIFYKTVRNSGGNNAKRYLLLPTYGARWSEHQYANLDMASKDDHCIMDIHYYSTNKTDYIAKIKELGDNIVKKGIPVIMGECGLNATVASDAKINWATNYVGAATENGIKCFLWDDGGNMQMFSRATLEWNCPEMAQAFVKAAGGAAPTSSTTTTTTTVTTSATTTTTTTETQPPILLGDVNGDGKLNGKDSLVLKMYNAGFNPTPFVAQAADVNGDGKINSKDSLLLRTKMVSN